MRRTVRRSSPRSPEARAARSRASRSWRDGSRWSGASAASRAPRRRRSSGGSRERPRRARCRSSTRGERRRLNRRAARGPARWAVPLALATGALLVASGASLALWRLAAPLAEPTAPATGLGSAKLRAALTRIGTLALQPPTVADLERSAATGECPEYRIGATPPAPEAQPASVATPPAERGRWPVLASLWVDPCRLAWLYQHPWDRGPRDRAAGLDRSLGAGAAALRLRGRRSDPRRDRTRQSALQLPDLLPGRVRRGRVARRAALVRSRGSDRADLPRREPGFRPRPTPLLLPRRDRLRDRTAAGRPGAPHPADPVHAQRRRVRDLLLGEHIGESFLERHFGHRNLDLVRGKREAGDQAEALWPAELDWIRSAPRPLTAARAATRYDLDQLTRWLVTVLFCATGELHQDAMIRDRSGVLAGGRWTWIHWDQDMSFRNPPGNSRFGREREVLPFLLWNHRPEETAPARELARRLLLEDPDYRERLVARIERALAEELTPAFLEDLVTRYETAARELGAEDLVFAEGCAPTSRRGPPRSGASSTCWRRSTRRESGPAGSTAPASPARRGCRGRSRHVGAVGSPLRMRSRRPARPTQLPRRPRWPASSRRTTSAASTRRSSTKPSPRKIGQRLPQRPRRRRPRPRRQRRGRLARHAAVVGAAGGRRSSKA